MIVYISVNLFYVVFSIEFIFDIVICICFNVVWFIGLILVGLSGLIVVLVVFIEGGGGYLVMGWIIGSIVVIIMLFCCWGLVFYVKWV